MVKVNVWKHFLGSIYVETDNSPYGSNIVKVEVDENRKIYTLSHIGSSGFMGKEFFEDCTFITKTAIPYKESDEYPWYRHQNVAEKAVLDLFGNDPIIPKKFPKTTEKPYPINNL